VNHFGPMIAADLRKRRPKPPWVWHLDEVYLKIGNRMVYLWCAVDAEGEVLDVLVQSKRNRHAALKLMRKLLKKYAFAPERLVTDDLRSYGSAARDLGLESRRVRGRWKNNRAENSHQPTRRRERKMQRFKSPVRPRNFFPRTPPSTPPSNVISPQPKRTACFARRRWTRGGRRSQPPDNSCAADALRSPHGNVTTPPEASAASIALPPGPRRECHRHAPSPGRHPLQSLVRRHPGWHRMTLAPRDASSCATQRPMPLPPR
jgi:DDE domain